MIDIKINQKPLSINAAHYRNKKKTVAYKNYQTAWEIHFKKAGYKKFPENKAAKYHVSFVFGFSNRASDVDNPLKPAIDTLQGLLGFNDKQIYILGAVKTIVPKGEEFVKVTMKEIANGKEDK